jgi:hypothetical protein
MGGIASDFVCDSNNIHNYTILWLMVAVAHTDAYFVDIAHTEDLF